MYCKCLFSGILLMTLAACGPKKEEVRTDFAQLIKDKVSQNLEVRVSQVRSGNGDKSGRFEYVNFSLYVKADTTLKSGIQLEKGKTINDCFAALIYQKLDTWKVQQFEINCKSVDKFRITFKA